MNITQPQFSALASLKSKHPTASKHTYAPLLAPRLAPLGADTVKFGYQDPDEQAYEDALTGEFAKDLGKFKIPKEMELTKDNQSVKVPYDYLDDPRFKRGSNEIQVGQGDGEAGDEVGEIGEGGDPQPADGPGEPGDPGDPGEGEGEGEGEEAGEGSGGSEGDADGIPQVSRDEIARQMEKNYNLELPNQRPVGKSNIEKMKNRWNQRSQFGTPGRIDKRTSHKNALKRSLAGGNKGKVTYRKSDFRYKDYEEITVPKENAVIIYLRDTSGSMGPKEKTMCKNLAFYSSSFIQYKYGQINAKLREDIVSDDSEEEGTRVSELYFLHESNAEEVNETDFYTVTKSGGTKFSTAYQEIGKLIDERFPADKNNIYIIHYTDGDNMHGDHQEALDELNNLIDKGVRMVGYVETRKNSTNGSAFPHMTKEFKENPFVRMTTISDGEPESYEKAVLDLFGPQSQGSGNGKAGRPSMRDRYA